MKLSKMAAALKPQSILVYGPPKSGKTQLAAELVRDGFKVVLLDLESGVQTFLTVLTPEELENVVYVRVPDTSTNPIAIETVGRLFAANSPMRVCEHHGKIECVLCAKAIKEGTYGDGADDAFTTLDFPKLGSDWVVVTDSLTQLSDSALNHATKSIQANLLSTAGKADWDAYAYQGMLLKQVLSNQQQARFHRVFISHESVVKQEDGAQLLFPVCGTENFSRQAARYFDHVVYCFRQNMQHKQASSTGFRANVLTGSRTDIALETGGSLANLLRGEKSAAQLAKEGGAAGAQVAAAKATVTGAQAAQQRVGAAQVSAADLLAKLQK